MLLKKRDIYLFNDFFTETINSITRLSSIFPTNNRTDNNVSDSCTITLKIPSLIQNSISSLYSALQYTTDGTVVSFSDLQVTDTIKGAYLISRLPVKISSLYTILNKTVRGSIGLTAVHIDTCTKIPIFTITSLSII